jgi:hypothetical protein
MALCFAILAAFWLLLLVTVVSMGEKQENVDFQQQKPPNCQELVLLPSFGHWSPKPAHPLAQLSCQGECHAVLVSCCDQCHSFAFAQWHFSASSAWWSIFVLCDETTRCTKTTQFQNPRALHGNHAHENLVLTSYAPT